MSEKSRVAVVYCDSYEREKVYRAMCAGIAAIGGIESLIAKDESILVKPNFLIVSEPDKAVITHPSVTAGMLRILKEHGYADIVCGDSPGHGHMSAAVTTAGLDEVFDKYGVRPAEMSKEVLVDYPEGVAAKQFYFAKAVTESDAIIGLSKMKTHALEKITGAVKNMYGLVCGYRKAEGHVKFPNASMFARMLADIHKCTKPRLHIMDGIVAMEGNGPGSGTPIAMNVLLFSTDPVALDTVFCRLVDLDPELIPTNVQGENIGIGSCHFEDIEIIDVRADAGAGAHMEGGNEYAEFQITPDELFARYGNAKFDVDRNGSKKTLLSRFSDIMTSVARRPYIDKELCVKCGICTEHCPVPGKAVNFVRGDRSRPPVYDYRKCIRCYCCQEMCPKHAIKVRRL